MERRRGAIVARAARDVPVRSHAARVLRDRGRVRGVRGVECKAPSIPRVYHGRERKSPASLRAFDYNALEGTFDYNELEVIEWTDR